MDLREKLFAVPRRMQAVAVPVIPIVAELTRRCPGTISLGQGVVSYEPPAQAFAAIPSCLADPENHKYKPVRGLPALIDSLTAKLAAENGIVSPTSIVVTAGSNLGFMNAILAISDPGDEIILQSPYYFNHHMAIALAGCKPVIAETDGDFQLSLPNIARAMTARTRAIVTVSPNNPTGVVYPEAALRAVNELCGARGIFHIHDEAYEYFTYGGARHFSPGRIGGSAAHTISLFSLSKAYGFASWRIGYMVIPEQLLFSVQKIQDTLLICPPVVSQFAAVGALTAGSAYCREKLGALAEIRELFLDRVQALQSFCTVPRADGAFYFFLKLATMMEPMVLVERLVREHGVAVIPGSAFGVEESCTLRVAYGALQRQTAAEGVARLVRGLKAIIRH